MRTVFRRRFNKHMKRASQRYREVLTRATGRGSGKAMSQGSVSEKFSSRNAWSVISDATGSMKGN